MFSVGIFQLHETTRAWRARLIIGIFLIGVFLGVRLRVAEPPFFFPSARGSSRRAQWFFPPLDLFAGTAIALLGKDMKPVRLLSVLHVCSFLTLFFG